MSVAALIRSLQVPTNGLVLYTGTILTDEGKEKKVNIDFEPFKTINTSLYLCDNKFHTEALSELLESENKYGFIVMDGNGALFGTLSGNTREVGGCRRCPVGDWRSDQPPPDPAQVHGGSAEEARPRRTVCVAFCSPAHGEAPQLRPQGASQAAGPACPPAAHVLARPPLRWLRCPSSSSSRKTRQAGCLALQLLPPPLTLPCQPNVAGVILAGSADFKTELSQSDLFDGRLQAVIVNIVDVSYGGENGFNQARGGCCGCCSLARPPASPAAECADQPLQAIELSTDILANVKFIQEKKLIAK